MDSLRVIIETYSRPRTIWQCSISRTSPKERGPAIERPLRRLERHTETVVAMGYSPERTQILACHASPVPAALGLRNNRQRLVGNGLALIDLAALATSRATLF